MQVHLETICSVGPSGVANPWHRQSVPDVPEDIDDEHMLHFNDLNWDFRANSSPSSISIDGVESEVDAEFQVSSRRMHDSEADFSCNEIQIQLVSFSSLPLSHCIHSPYFIRDSPYPEVRAAVANTDDPTMVVNTFRV